MKQDEHWKELLSAVQDEEWDDAIQSIDGLIRREPSDPGHYEKLGDFYLNGRNADEALSAFTSALQLYKRNHESAKAIVVCNKILALAPDRHDVATDLEVLLRSHEDSNRLTIRLDALRPEQKALGGAGAADKLRMLAAAGTASELLRILSGTTSPGVFDDLEPFDFKPGETVIREGQMGDSIFVIISGWVEISSVIQGRRVSLSTLTEGDIFGEMAFLTSRPRTATVTAITDLEVFEVKKPLLDKIIEPRPHLLRYLYNVYVSRMDATLAEIKSSVGGCLSGSLRELPLAEIMQVLELTRKEGKLIVSAGGVQGTISFSPGMIEDTVCNQMTGDDAMIALLSLPEGIFSFEPGKVETGKISQPVRQVLLEAIRRMDERKAGLQ